MVHRMLDGFAGSVEGSYFSTPKWVDPKNEPGHTSMKKIIPAPMPSLAYKYATLSFFFYSPNLIWFAFAAFVWVVFPYDMEVVKAGFSVDWVGYRALINLFVTFGYFGFWHVTLYFLNWAKRPFLAGRVYRYSKVMHNIWYCFLGVMQWTLWEAAFLRCYVTGRLPYIPRSQTDPTSVLIFIAWFFLVPLYRDLHFYFAHRFIHTRFVYKFVHSVHHRNTDIEPFAGLSMHPIEHLLYFSCVGPIVYTYCSPFAMLWMGMHLLLSPAASHSGYEDNMQSDLYHYLHHVSFECNYGTGGIPFDSWFGTFRDRIAEKGGKTTYSGGAKEVSAAESNKLDMKATLNGQPEVGAMYFAMFAVLLPLLALIGAATGKWGVSEWKLGPVEYPYLVALLVSVGPLFVAAGIHWIDTFKSKGGLRRRFLSPFHKENWLGSLGFHIFFGGFIVCVLPTYHLITTLLLPPGEGPACQLLPTYC